jgi:ferrous iron transport protein B
MDEAERLGLKIDVRSLSRDLGIPVVPTSARYRQGLPDLLKVIEEITSGEVVCRPHRVRSNHPGLNQAISQLVAELEQLYPSLPNRRWVALRLLDGDEQMQTALTSGEIRKLAETEEKGPSPSELERFLTKAEKIRWKIGAEFQEALMESIYSDAASIADRTLLDHGHQAFRLGHVVDRLVTSRIWGFPLMLLLLTGVFWLTVSGANWPSAMLSTVLLDTFHPFLKEVSSSLGIPAWIDGIVLDGMYLATAWVVSVMLPPMAIFFPLFTLLEDLGYLPRVAFNLDHLFKRFGAHGKQALTLAMGFGCNAAGVIATRIIESPRERLIAILTNNFALCNGRWPTQILIATLFIGSLVPAHLAGMVSALAVVTVALLGIALTFLVSWFLSRTWLRGEVSSFTLELPPYRPPRILQTIYTSLIDRTIFVLWRAIVFALPAGAAIWFTSNVYIGETSIAEHLIQILNPLGFFLGLNGVILLAYIVAIPANEIVIPTILMLTVMGTGLESLGEGAGVMFELESDADIFSIFNSGGWTLLTAVNLMLFSLIHNPCSTTLYTILKETGSKKWTAVAATLPLLMGFCITFLVASIWRVLFPAS